GDDNLTHFRAVRQPCQQAVKMQLVGPHAVERRNPAAENVVAPAVAAGPLDGPDVARLLDHAQKRPIPARIPANPAPVRLGEVAARTAGRDLAADPANGVRQALRGLRGLLQQVEREPLGGLTPDAGELRELRHELLDGRHETPGPGGGTPKAGAGMGTAAPTPPSAPRPGTARPRVSAPPPRRPGRGLRAFRRPPGSRPEDRS